MWWNKRKATELKLPQQLDMSYLVLYSLVRWNLGLPSWDTIKKHYLKWREQQGKPYVCEVPGCQLPNQVPLWSGVRLVLIMDHKNGKKRDNRVENLRLTCPNCDSQLVTKGGGNKERGKDLADNAYKVVGPDGEVSFVYIAEGGVKLGGNGEYRMIIPNQPPQPPAGA